MGCLLARRHAVIIAQAMQKPGSTLFPRRYRRKQPTIANRSLK